MEFFTVAFNLQWASGAAFFEVSDAFGTVDTALEEGTNIDSTVLLEHCLAMGP